MQNKHYLLIGLCLIASIELKARQTALNQRWREVIYNPRRNGKRPFLAVPVVFKERYFEGYLKRGHKF
jgi:hypothetical protein